MSTREATGAVSNKRTIDCYAESPVATVREQPGYAIGGFTDSGTTERPKSSVSMPTVTRPSLILQRCAIRKRSCFEKSGQSVGNNLRRESGSCSAEPSASLSERACKMRAICGEDSPGEVCDEDAAPKKSQRTCRRVQLMLWMRFSIYEKVVVAVC